LRMWKTFIYVCTKWRDRWAAIKILARCWDILLTTSLVCAFSSFKQTSTNTSPKTRFYRTVQ
jgi:hypothetical protein